MDEITTNPIQALVTGARERIAQEISAKAEQMNSLEQTLQILRENQKSLQNEIDRLLNEFQDHRKKLQEEIERQLSHLVETSMRELREQHQTMEQAIAQQFDALAKYEPPPPPAPIAPLDKVLNAVRNLITATLPEQVLEVLTEEAEQIGVRAAVFDVRGKAAWGSSARGFGHSLSAKTFRALVVPLNQDGPFRQTFETGGPVEATADLLKKNRNILEKFKPTAEDSILLLPIRSAGSVSAIFYADSGAKNAPLPDDALKILAEFAGAQLDRLMALSGGAPEEAAEEDLASHEQEHEPEMDSTPAVTEESRPDPEPARGVSEEREAEEQLAAHSSVSTAVEEVPSPAPEPEPIPAAASSVVTPDSLTATVAAPGFDISQLSEEEQKLHKDGKRFAKLLVSEIDLYNKTKVADGRKNKDLYKRLKSDIDRSRLTFMKRFSKTLANQVDYFHEEIVRTLASSDASLMGPEYPGSAA